MRDPSSCEETCAVKEEDMKFLNSQQYIVSIINLEPLPATPSKRTWDMEDDEGNVLEFDIDTRKEGED